MRQNLRHSRFKLLLKGTQTFALNCYTTVLETTMVENIKQNVVWFKWNPTLWPYYCQSLTDPCKWDQTPFFFLSTVNGRLGLRITSIQWNSSMSRGACMILSKAEGTFLQQSLQKRLGGDETGRNKAKRSVPHRTAMMSWRRGEISETYHLTQTTVIWNCIVPFTMKQYHKKKKKNRKGKHK